MKKTSIEKGYIKLPRAFFEESSSMYFWPPEHKWFWQWLIQKASHQSRKIGGITYHRGALLTTYDEMRNALTYKKGWETIGCSKSKIQGIIRKLKKCEMIVTRKTTVGMVITILNYAYYQDATNYEGDKEEHKPNKEQAYKRSTIYKNGKNLNNLNRKVDIVKKNTIISNDSLASSETIAKVRKEMVDKGIFKAKSI